jgi:hypothetical protein
MLERLKIGTRLAVGFGLVSLVLAAVVVTGVTRLAALDDDIKTITRTNNVEMRHASEMQSVSLQIGNCSTRCARRPKSCAGWWAMSYARCVRFRKAI